MKKTQPKPNPSNLLRRRVMLTGTGALLTPWLAACGGDGDTVNVDPAVPGAERPVLGPAPLKALSQQIPTRVYGNDAYPVWYRRALPSEAPRARYPGFKPAKYLLKKGEVRREGSLALPVDISMERDVAVKLRDGTIMYVDVFRPTTEGTFPVIISYSPYGKEIGNSALDDFPFRSGVPQSQVSDLQAWEGADPAFWVQQGYTIINVDPRGSYQSEGNVPYWGRQLAEDGYDVVEWAAAQSWSNGRVGMAGNSWLASAQWFIAAERPPHLAAIAPWEGISDILRDFGLLGGIPNLQFSEDITQIMGGEHLVEDLPKMILAEQDDTAYWKSKAARVANITIPAYVVASYDNTLHSMGTFRAYRGLGSSEKWLRVHNSFEWPDFYSKEATQELLSFFDCYLKEESNNWRSTPKVRISVIDPGGVDAVNREIDVWPPGGYASHALYLNADQSMTAEKAAVAASVSYAVPDGSAVFRAVVDQEIELAGYLKLKLWVEAKGADDMDVSIQLQKLDRLGNPIPRASGPFQLTGQQRASRRKLDVSCSTESEPVLLLMGEERLTAGQIVPLEIAIRPVALRLHVGEIIELRVSPYVAGSAPLPLGTSRLKIPLHQFTFPAGTEVPSMLLGGDMGSSPAFIAEQAVVFPVRNAGTQVIHVGGTYDSHLLVPLKRVN